MRHAYETRGARGPFRQTQLPARSGCRKPIGLTPGTLVGYVQSGRPTAAAGRSEVELVDEPAPAEVDVPLELLLPLDVLGVVVVVLVLPVWVFVISRTCLVALSQHLPWLTLAEGVLVVVVL
jgi:hypothetical protein